MDELVTIFVVLISVGMPLSIPIVYMDYRKRSRFIELHHAERMAAIERGMEIPALPLGLLGMPPPNRSVLLPGLIWLFGGLALMAALSGVEGVASAGRLSLWGLIPAAVGLAYLVYYFVEGRKITPSAREGT